MTLQEPAPPAQSGAEFTWPPPTDTSQVFALDLEGCAFDDQGPRAKDPETAEFPVVPTQPDISASPVQVPYTLHTLPVLPARDLTSWRALGRLVLVFLFVAISGSTFLGVNVAREPRHVDVRSEGPVLPVRSVGGAMALLPMLGVQNAEAADLLRSVRLHAIPVRVQPEIDRPADFKAARTGEPRRVGPGWISIELPIQLEIYEDGRFVGTNGSDRIVFAAGEHQLELVNESLHYRSKQVVSVAPGRFTPVRVALPSGVLHVNALPWGDVTIDGRPAGQTPLGNLRLPIGPHQIVFRHPQFGEQTRTALVTLGGPAHVTVDWRK